LVFEVTIDYFLGIALGRLGLTPEQFYEMRLKHFFLMVMEYTAAREEKNKLICELFRMQTTDLLNINLKEHQRIKPGKLWRFPWDEDVQFENQIAAMNKDEFERNYKEFLGID